VNNADSVSWVTGVAEKALDSVVTISVGSSTAAGSGSGVFLTADGYILTNTHVVTLDGSTADGKIQVKTANGRVYRATLIGTDPTNDLAVIKISGTFTPIVFADSSKVNVGDSTVAIGAPLGLEETVTAGIVSALNRTIQVASSEVPQGGLQLWNGTGAAPVSLRVIQTDAAINPGNSGGALLNNRGELIGINVAIATAGSTSGSQAGSIGVGFSIPSNIAKRVAAELMKDGVASHALLGALVQDEVDRTNSAAFTSGAVVKELTPGGPAAKGGMKVGDVVVSFNGVDITASGDLVAAVRLEPAGAPATIVVMRDGVKLTLEVTLGDAADAN
jgi:putative serine protease PepD